MSDDSITKINEVIADYFDRNPKTNWIAAKEIMPFLIKAGVFNKDEKKGLPLRKVLRALDKENALDKIPFVHAERTDESIYWYLVREGASYAPKESTYPVSKKPKGINVIESSDENYIIDLCDELLNEKASRQQRFDFLLGDLHKDGKTRTALPVDAYYQSLNLVIEFLSLHHSESAGSSDKHDRMTISGVSRAEQRKIYDQRKREVLKEKNFNLIEIDYSLFEFDSNKRLLRNKENDSVILMEIIKDFLNVIDLNE